MWPPQVGAQLFSELGGGACTGGGAGQTEVLRGDACGHLGKQKEAPGAGAGRRWHGRASPVAGSGSIFIDWLIIGEFCIA